MKHFFVAAFLVLLTVGSMTVRGQSSLQKQTEYLEAIPAEYFENADQSGQVLQVTYESRDYTGSDTTITKPAWVYLPYGYDENDTGTRYDILYLMHGWTMTANDFLGEGRNNLVKILDNLIAFGDIPPVIVVSATFDAENQPQSFSRSVEELSVFHHDLRENLMPYIEERFHTYAEDVTEEGFENSREHRAFGGFSLGAVTTWYQFIYNLDYIKNFVPMSGDCWIMGTYGGRYYPVETVDYLEDMLAEGGYEKNDFRIYQGIGTDDPIWGQTVRYRRCLPAKPLRREISTMPSSKAGDMIWMPAKDTFIMPCRTFSPGRHKVW